MADTATIMFSVIIGSAIVLLLAFGAFEIFKKTIRRMVRREVLRIMHNLVRRRILRLKMSVEKKQDGASPR